MLFDVVVDEPFAPCEVVVFRLIGLSGKVFYYIYIMGDAVQLLVLIIIEVQFITQGYCLHTLVAFFACHAEKSIGHLYYGRRAHFCFAM